MAPFGRVDTLMPVLGQREDMTSYRPLADDEVDSFLAYTQYAFNPQSTPDPDADLEGPRSVGDARGVFVDGIDRPVAVCAQLWFEATVRGVPLSMPGLSAVAVPPEYRRQGYARTLVRNSLKEYRDRGDHLSILWPFKTAFYRSLGYGRGHRYVIHEVDPASLQHIDVTQHGRFRPVDADEWATLDAVYDAATDGYELAIDRTEDWWRHRVFESFQGEHYAYVWDDDAGDPRGYLIFRHSGNHRDRTLSVVDMAATDPNARRQLYRFLGDHDSQVSTVKLTEVPDAPLLDHLPVRSGIETTLHPGTMVRLVDVPSVLETIDYPPDVSGSLVIDVEDDLVGWHDAPIELTLADGDATVTRTDATPTIELDIGVLSAIVAGLRPVERFVAAGDIEGAREDIDLLAAAFPPRQVMCFDRF